MAAKLLTEALLGCLKHAPDVCRYREPVTAPFTAALDSYEDSSSDGYAMTPLPLHKALLPANLPEQYRNGTRLLDVHFELLRLARVSSILYMLSFNKLKSSHRHHGQLANQHQCSTCLLPCSHRLCWIPGSSIPLAKPAMDPQGEQCNSQHCHVLNL